MKLSMWMLVNRLHNFEVEVHIRENSPVNLKSARRAYATDCVYVYQSDEHSVCQSGQDYIVIKDMDAQEAVEIVQSVFDYYNDWDTVIRDAAIQMDFQTVIDKSWHIFHNPVVLMDAAWNVLAISKQYKHIELDEEWAHLCNYGSTSLSAFQSLRNDPNSNYNIVGSQYYRMNNDSLSNCISSLIMSNSAVCGRITVVEHDRELNRGDRQIVDYLVRILAPHMGYLNKSADTSFYSVFQNLLTDQIINSSQLQQYMEYMNWQGKKDSYYVLAVCPKNNLVQSEDTILLSNKLSRLLPQCDVAVVENNVVLMIASKDLGESVIDTIYKTNMDQGYAIGKSLPFSDIQLCRYFYNQAVFAAFHGNAAIADKYEKGIPYPEINYFYDCAIEFIIRNGDRNEAIAACHPDILKLWHMDQEQNMDRIHTFKAYLNNERSLMSAAQELFVHRNTLVYRINKIVGGLTCNLEEVYTRDYMKLSIRILELYKDLL